MPYDNVDLINKPPPLNGNSSRDPDILTKGLHYPQPLTAWYQEGGRLH